MKKILIVDDEDKIREVIKEYAEFSGYAAEEAADGMSAIGMVKLNDYDLIIMDIMMPKLDGFSAVKEIQKIKNIPVIMLSARGEEYDTRTKAGNVLIESRHISLKFLTC